jgi:uncharacterized cupredoxin-like copper-binding protein
VKRIMIGAVAAAAIAVIGTPALAGRDAAPQARQSAKLVANVKVTAKDLSFTLSAKSAKRGLVIFKVTNAGALKHDFSIKGRTTKMLSHGQSATLRITFLKKGSYPYKCTVPGHAAAGMKGVFTIK